MTVTFDPALTDDISRIRQTIGQTESNAVIQDETITALMAASGATEGSVAIALCYNLSAYYANKVDTTLDGQGFRYSQISTRFQELGDRLKREGVATGADPSPVAGEAAGGGIVVTGVDWECPRTSERGTSYPLGRRFPPGF